MELLFGAVLYAMVIYRMWLAARTDHTLAQQGIVSPRLEAKYGRRAPEVIARYGFWDFARDAWASRHVYRLAALKAAKDAPPAAPARRVGWRQRLAAAGTVLATATDQAARSRTVQRLIQPVGDRRQPPPPTGTSEDGGPAATQPETPPATPPDTPAGKDGPRPDAAPNSNGQHGGQPTPNAQTGKDQTMTAPTAGEAADYETTIASLESLAADQRAELDAAAAACESIGRAKDAVDAMQTTYNQSAGAASAVHDQLASMHLDQTTLAHTGETADALPAGRVDQLFDHLEQVEQVAVERRDAAQTALAATEAAIDHVQKTYGDAHTTVAENLSGDASFLHSGGGAGTGPAGATQSTATTGQAG